MTQDTKWSDIFLTPGEGLQLPIAIVYTLAGILIAGFHYPALWIMPALAAFLLAGFIVQAAALWRLRNTRLVYRSGGWLSVGEDGASVPVACDFTYVSSWLVAIRVITEGQDKPSRQVFLAAATSRETWRQLQLLIRGGKQ